MTPAQRRKLGECFAAAILPPERVLPSTWARANLVLSERTTNYPGAYNPDLTPYAREPLDKFADRDVLEIVLCWGAQSAKTQTLLAQLGFAIDRDPGPAIFAQTNEKLVKYTSRNRIQPLIDDCPALARHKPSNADLYSTLEMDFGRMLLTLVGANSEANLASRPARHQWMDEIADWPEGAVELLEERAKTFWNKKLVKSGTPKFVYDALWRSFLAGDRRRYHLPCSHCRHAQPLVFDQIRWAPESRRDDGTWDLQQVRRTAIYHCVACDGPIRDAEKHALLRRGEWIPESDSAGPSSITSYHLNSLYPIWVRWADVAEKFLRSYRFPDALRRFRNLWLALPFEPPQHSATEEQILAHRGDYAAGHCPIDPVAVVLTADVQHHSCYYVIRAYDRWETSYLLRYGQVPSLAALERVSQSRFRGPNGDVRVDPRYRLVDSGDGTQTERIYRFCERFGWIPTKGSDSQLQLRAYAWSKALEALPLLHFNSRFAKDTLDAKLGVGLADPGAWLLPRDAGLDYARQITAEVRVEETNAKGFRTHYWKPIRTDNHYLDCEAQQIAACLAIGFRYLDEASGPEPDNPDPDDGAWLPQAGQWWRGFRS